MVREHGQFVVTYRELVLFSISAVSTFLGLAASMLLHTVIAKLETFVRKGKKETDHEYQYR